MGGSHSLLEITLPDAVMDVCLAIARAGGRAWLVGGWVRDGLMTKPTPLKKADYDLEIYGLPLAAVQLVAAEFGSVIAVGKSFAVLKLCCDGIEMDLALPRCERSFGVGHRDFEVVADPQMTHLQASSRRDFTINAMMYDPLEHQLLDFHNGQADVCAGLLRHVGDAFIEDPLRPLRAMQFCARFNGALAEETASLCRSMVAMADALPVERIWQEWRKWALADYPDAGLRALEDSGWLHCYPSLAVLMNTPQEACWHPEGDVWQHTMQVCAQAAQIAKREKISENRRLALMFAALCHDLGKPVTTEADDAGVLRSRGHAQAGITPTQALMAAIGAPQWLIEQVLPLVREHLVHLHGQPTLRAVRRLACRLQPSSVEMWEHLIEADASGRHPHPADRPAKAWLHQAQALVVTHKPPQPLVTGKWLLKHGMIAGPAIGKMLDNAWQAQLDGVIASNDDIEQWWNQHRPA